VKKIVSVLFLSFLLALIPFTVSADLMTTADGLYDLGGMENIKKSIDLYNQILGADAKDYVATWKLARAYRDYGDDAKGKTVEGWKKLCAEYGKKGMETGQKAIDLEPNKPEGHYYYGLSVGVYADGVSILTALKEGLKGKTQTSFEKVYEIDKMWNEAGAMVALGRFWMVLPWPMKDKKASLKYLREYQTTEFFNVGPEGPIYLAELLIKIGGKENKAEAKTLLEAVKPDSKFFEGEKARLLKKV
jgi:hypothetical protein